MSLPANKVETNNNDEFSKFVFRQSFQAQQYYAQFNNQQFDQFGNPISNQQNFNNEMNQGFNPQGQPQQNVNPNALQGEQSQGFNEVGAQAQQAPEVKQEEVVVGEQNVEVVPQVEVTPTVEEIQVETAPTAEEVAPQVETIPEVKVEVVGGARSRRLQKLNKAEEEAVFKKRR